MVVIRQNVKAALGALGLLNILRRTRASFTYPFKNMAHISKEICFRIPNPVLKAKYSTSTPKRMLQLVNTLCKDGIVILPEFVRGEQLKKMKREFGSMIQKIESSPPSEEMAMPKPWEKNTYREQAFDTDLEVTYTNNPFRLSPELLKIAVNDYIVDIVSRYFSKKCMLHQAVAHRYYPTEKRDFGSWQWHHDGWGKRINALVILTDVTEHDQYMSYMKGSHRLIHSYNKNINSRFTEAEVKAHPEFERVDCLCPAGTVFLIDPNGMHRGNRSMGAHRDTLISSYSCGRYIWNFDIPERFIEELQPQQSAFLMNNPHINII